MAIHVIKPPSAVTGPAIHSPAGGVVPRTGKAHIGHAIHQSRALRGPGFSIQPLTVRFK